MARKAVVNIKLKKNAIKLLVKASKEEEEIARFKAAAAKYSAKATVSQKSARKVLTELGTHTPTGKLTKQYR